MTRIMEYKEFYKIMLAGQEQPIEPKHEKLYNLRCEQLYSQLQADKLTIGDVNRLSLAFRSGADLGTDITALIFGETSGVKPMAARAKGSLI